MLYVNDIFHYCTMSVKNIIMKYQIEKSQVYIHMEFRKEVILGRL